MSAALTIERIEAAGGMVTLKDGQIHCRLPEACAPLLEDLRMHRAEAITLLQGRADMVSDDAYAERLQAALDSICQPSYPPGLIVWLSDNRPDLYHMLITTIPDTLDKLWSSNGRIEDFEASLATWRETHAEAVRELKTTKRLKH